ncbi:MAG: RsmB/NOP family class I SAM-dependent RNA methyltransferase, partial [Halobacteriaceae archaeon]
MDEATADDPLSRYADIVEDVPAFRAACDRPLPPVVRVNPIAVDDPDHVIETYEDAGVGVDPIEWADDLLALDCDRPGNTWPYVHGWVHGQEAVSALPAPVLDPEPGDRVLDLCAAPGSKTTQLAGLQDDKGTIVANDVDLGRLSALRPNCDRLGVTSTVVTNRDGRHLSPTAFGMDAFDRVLVDAPCSCEGTVRKNPDALTEWSLDYLDQIAAQQRQLLAQAVSVTRPGGTVVYATCTFAPEENEAVIDAVLEQGDCQLVDIDLSVTHTDGIRRWQDSTFDRSVRRCVRVYPHHNDTGGFFLAKL